MGLKLSKQHFWKWFELNNKEFLQLSKKTKTDTTYWINEMVTHLRAYGRYMSFSLEHDETINTGVLTITSGGKSRFFKKIDDFVAKAPLINGWKIYALEQPCEIDLLLKEQFPNTIIDPHDLWFSPDIHEMDGHPLDITVYSTMYREDRDDSFESAVATIIHNLLGERVFALEMGIIEVANRSSAEESTELIRLQELPSYLGNRKSPIIVDSSGQIRDNMSD
ncbi:MAG: hypothetical protein H7Y03_14240 [Chitinophagaceae bacterium]|nr:hypothetical protein [Chitinophagaceae bacterium]